jgi:hypothetical protein
MGQQVTRITGQDTTNGKVAVVVTYQSQEPGGPWPEVSNVAAMARDWDEAYLIMETVRGVLRRVRGDAPPPAPGPTALVRWENERTGVICSHCRGTIFAQEACWLDREADVLVCDVCAPELAADGQVTLAGVA